MVCIYISASLILAYSYIRVGMLIFWGRFTYAEVVDEFSCLKYLFNLPRRSIKSFEKCIFKYPSTGHFISRFVEAVTSTTYSRKKFLKNTPHNIKGPEKNRMLSNVVWNDSPNWFLRFLRGRWSLLSQSACTYAAAITIPVDFRPPSLPGAHPVLIFEGAPK